MTVQCHRHVEVALLHHDRDDGQSLVRPIYDLAFAMVGGKEIQALRAEIQIEVVMQEDAGGKYPVEGYLIFWATEIAHHLELDAIVLGIAKVTS